VETPVLVDGHQLHGLDDEKEARQRTRMFRNMQAAHQAQAAQQAHAHAEAQAQARAQAQGRTRNQLHDDLPNYLLNVTNKGDEASLQQDRTVEDRASRVRRPDDAGSKRFSYPEMSGAKSNPLKPDRRKISNFGNEGSVVESTVHRARPAALENTEESEEQGEPGETEGIGMAMTSIGLDTDSSKSGLRVRASRAGLESTVLAGNAVIEEGQHASGHITESGGLFLTSTGDGMVSSTIPNVNVSVVQDEVSTSEWADCVGNELSTGDRFDSDIFDDPGAGLLGNELSQRPLIAGDKLGSTRRSRMGSSNLPPSHPSMDALTKSLLQRDFSMDGMRLGRDFSTDMLNRRMRSRECSFEHGGLTQSHRDMSMSIEFPRSLRSHLSMEMQLSGQRINPGPHQGSVLDELGVGATDVIASEFPSSISAHFMNTDGLWTADTGSSLNASAQFGIAGHISRSFRGRSKDDLMLDLRGGQGPDRDRYVRFPNSGTLEDVRDAKHPF
jgi:hypothetical protein